MNESREFKGIWYLPNNRDNAVAGILYFTKGKVIRLELIGSLSNENNPSKIFLDDELSMQQIIYGESSDAKKITLINCHKGEQSLNASCSFPLTSFTCQYIVIGSHLTDKDEKRFNRIIVNIPVLSQWLIPTLIEDRFGNEMSTNYELKIPTKQKTHLEVEVNSNFKLSLISRSSFSGNINYPNVLKVSQFTFFEVESINGKVSFQELIGQANLFIQFLSFASVSTQTPTEIYFSDYDYFQDINGEIFFNTTEILYIIRNVDLREEKINLLFNFNKIESEFSEIIKKWYSFSSDLAPIRNHLLNSIQHKPVFSSLDFLIVVQALEGYHTRFINKKRVFLKPRIEDLIARYSPDVQKIAKIDIDVQIVVNTRDYYSHFFETDKKVFIKEGIELLRLTEKMRLLLVCCILDLIGFSKQKINEIINKHNLFNVEN